MPTHLGNLVVGVLGILVEANDDMLTEATQIGHMTVEVPEAIGRTGHVWFLNLLVRHATMHLQRLQCDHQHRTVGLQSGLAAFDIVELLGTEVSTEAGLSDGVVAVAERHLRGHDGVAAMRDIGKRTAMNEGRRTLSGLHEVGLEGIHEQYGDGAFHAHVAYVEGLVVVVETEENIADAPFQVVDGCGEAHDGHNLGGRRDVETRLSQHAVGGGADAGDDGAQVTVVDIHHAAPQHLFQTEAVGSMLIDIVIKQRSNHVVGRGDGVEVTREMEVDLVHRQHLRVATAASATLLTEAGSERRLTQGHDSALADAVEAKRQPHADRGLADAGLGWTDGSDQHQMVLLHLLFVDGVERHLGDVAAVLFRLRLGNAELSGNVGNGAQLCALCDFDICLHSE